VNQDNQALGNEDLDLYDEDLIKSWRIDDPYYYLNNNLVTLSSHCVTLETSRVHHLEEHASLKIEKNIFVLTSFLKLFRSIRSFFYNKLTYGKFQPEVINSKKTILLKDVVNVEVDTVYYSELIDRLLFIFYLCLVACLFLFSNVLAIIIALIALIQICVVLVSFISADFKNDTALPNIILISADLVTMIIFLIVLYISTTLWWLALTFGSFGVATTIVLIRFNLQDSNKKSSITITSRRGCHKIALKNDDAIDAKHHIWKLRNDIQKLSPINHESAI